jgi:hypothetical protein
VTKNSSRIFECYAFGIVLGQAGFHVQACKCLRMVLVTSLLACTDVSPRGRHT